MILVIPYQEAKTAVLYDMAVKAGYKPIPKFLESDIHYESELCTLLTNSEFGTMKENNAILKPFKYNDVTIALDRINEKDKWVTLLPSYAVDCVMEHYTDCVICSLPLKEYIDAFVRENYKVYSCDLTTFHEICLKGLFNNDTKSKC